MGRDDESHDPCIMATRSVVVVMTLTDNIISDVAPQVYGMAHRIRLNFGPDYHVSRPTSYQLLKKFKTMR